MLMHQSRLAPIRVVGAVLAIAAATLIADVAAAKEPGVARTVVNYSDLDLTRPEDAARLYARLKNASQQVCYTNERLTVQVQRLQEDCIHGALSRAVANVNDAKLTALHQAEPRIRLARRS
jgi:UrcA family protein